MIERFHFDPAATYPGKATVIFYKNGPSVEFDETGKPKLSEDGQQKEPYYMEAELNSPLVTLEPGANYAFDTTWFPLRTGADVLRVTEAGIVTSKLQVSGSKEHIGLKGTFGVVIPGHLQLRLYTRSGRDAKNLMLDAVSPQKQVTLDQDIPVDFAVSRVSLHLLDDDGKDWGMIDEAGVRGDQ